MLQIAHWKCDGKTDADMIGQATDPIARAQFSAILFAKVSLKAMIHRVKVKEADKMVTPVISSSAVVVLQHYCSIFWSPS